MLLPLFIVFYPFSTNSQSSLPSQVEHQCQNRMVRGGKKVILHLAYDQAEWSLSPYLSLWLSNFVCNFMKESCSDLCSRACSPTALTNPRICAESVLLQVCLNTFGSIKLGEEILPLIAKAMLFQENFTQWNLSVASQMSGQPAGYLSQACHTSGEIKRQNKG